jgi:fucose 4-O-acetylase-like acetyltransferase
MRNGLIDYGRFAAALGLVWFFTQAPGNRIAYLSVPFLLVVLTLPTTGTVRSKARRLLVPFLVWSLVFAVVQVALALKHSEPTFGWWESYMVLTGTWAHLWILPFAFLASILAPWFQHPLASLGAALLVALLMSVKGTPEAVPFGLWSFGIIPILVGIAFFAWGWRLAMVTLLLSSVVLILGRPAPDNITIIVGTALALLIMSIHVPATPVSDWCGRMSSWIILSHPLAIIVGQSLRITWVELALFSVVVSVVLAMILDATIHGGRRDGADCPNPGL